MYSRHHVLALGLIFALTTASHAAHGKNGVKTAESQQSKEQEKAAKEAEKTAKKSAQDAEKLTKDAEKFAKKAAKEAEKSQRIELLAKMKQAEADDSDNEVEVDVSENEASLKYRVKSGSHKLTAEVEGFADGDVMKMYVVINNQEVLVASLELVDDGTIPRQEVEFDDATWPTGVPLDLPSGTLVKVRDAQGTVVLEGSLVAKK